MEEIRVTIQDGHVTIETSGFVGPACQQATERLSRALGRRVKETPKPELFQVAGTGLEQKRDG